MKLVEQKAGGFGIIQKNEDGTISQIGLTESQNKLLEYFLSSLSSEEEPLRRLPMKYNLTINLIE